MERAELSARDSSLLLASLGKAHDDIDAYDKAFSYFRRLNEDSGKAGNFDSPNYWQKIKEVKQIFDEPGKLSTNKPTDKVPIFVVGMSRSGKTLVESLLAQNPEVFAAGELHDWREAVETVANGHELTGEFPAYTNHLMVQHLHEIAGIYMKQIIELSPQSRLFVNTMPGYFAYIGLIFLCLPTAKVIHCTRNVLDNGLYMYFKQYRHGHDYSYDLQDLAEYYKRYCELLL